MRGRRKGGYYSFVPLLTNSSPNNNRLHRLHSGGPSRKARAKRDRRCYHRDHLTCHNLSKAMERSQHQKHRQRPTPPMLGQQLVTNRRKKKRIASAIGGSREVEVSDTFSYGISNLMLRGKFINEFRGCVGVLARTGPKTGRDHAEKPSFPSWRDSLRKKKPVGDGGGRLRVTVSVSKKKRAVNRYWAWDTRLLWIAPRVL